MTLFVGYLALISLLPDLRRVFQYHAAEHKAINCYEAGDELTPENVQRHSLIHVRCGTAFLLWVMVIAIFVFAFFGHPAWYWLIATRILLLPVIAGLAYELIRFAGKHAEQQGRALAARARPLAPAADHARSRASTSSRSRSGRSSRCWSASGRGRPRRAARRSHGLDGCPPATSPGGPALPR